MGVREGLALPAEQRVADQRKRPLDCRNGPRLPDGRVYDAGEHERNEAELRTFVGVLAAEARRAPRGRPSEASERCVMSAFARFAVNALDWKRDWLVGDVSTGFHEALLGLRVEFTRAVLDRPFLRALERRSPFRLKSITAARGRVSKAKGTRTALLERWRGEDERDGRPRAPQPVPTVPLAPA